MGLITRFRVVQLLILGVLLNWMAFAQQPPQGEADRGLGSSSAATPSEPKRVFWIIPNYRSSPTLVNYKPLTTAEKFKLATQDSFDRGTIALAAVFAADGQLTNSNPSFGQGAKGYAHYFGTSMADFVIGDYMTEAIYPALLHQDPRYFRKGTGGGMSRLGYAIGQIFWTHTDRGGKQFNFSEIAGNATGAAIGVAYYPDNRTAADAGMKLGIQLGVDMAGNVLKEFWPDIYRKLARKKHGGQQ
jgi:hypothetical protein